MSHPINPYIAGNPVGNTNAFVGRADILRDVLRVLRRPQDNAIVLYGQRRIGKTSVLQHLVSQLPTQGNYCPIYFDLQDKATLTLGEVVSQLAQEMAHALKQTKPDLGEQPEITFRETWLPTVLQNLPKETALILLFDEFDVLAAPDAQQAGSAFFPYLRQILTYDPQRLNFIFVIGRNVDDLDHIALSLFKGVDTKQVSLLNQEDTKKLIRLSEANHSLKWPDETMEYVWQHTNGHAFLTQQLCSNVWEQIYDDAPETLPTATPENVENVIFDALDSSRNTLEWLWQGLPPAERVVASALAEAGPKPITELELEKLLHESGVRVVIRELQNAPHLLQDWDLLEPADEGGYRFRVELLRLWIQKNKPLKRVQDELDRIDPAADSLYNASLSLYRNGMLDATLAPLRQAVSLNPNHVGANQLLADILLAQGQAGEACEILERLYEYQPVAARPRLVQALLALVQSNENEDEQLKLYEQVLKLDGEQPEAQKGRREIWQRRGDAAYKANDLETALAAYKTANLGDKVAEIEQEIRDRKFEAQLKALEEAERAEHHKEALELAQQLAKKYPDKREWSADLERLARKIKLEELYQRALEALEEADKQKAQSLLAEVIFLEPTYKEASRYLHLAVTGIDVAKLQDGITLIEQIPKQLMKEMYIEFLNTDLILQSRSMDIDQIKTHLSNLKSNLKNLFNLFQSYKAIKQVTLEKKSDLEKTYDSAMMILQRKGTSALLLKQQIRDLRNFFGFAKHKKN
ncbi:MAG: ATP-binding protein [Candidatus Parabeggiatoa sp.]|nr:ATP-binding protein [Candidatus Parabeggiatoa sp.]